MKHRMRMLLLFVALLNFAPVSAQEPPRAAEALETLKLQLIELQGRDENLRSRLQQLDYELKPENIERSLAGIGSTKPEELREHRRRQLSIERDAFVAHLQTLEMQRVRLERAIVDAENRAYQQSASPPPQSSSLILKPGALSSSPVKFALVLLLLTATAGALFFYFRRGVRTR